MDPLTMSQLLAFYASPGEMNSSVGLARETKGSSDPRVKKLAGYSQPDLAQLDRYSYGAATADQVPQLLHPLGAAAATGAAGAYEAAKGLGLAPLIGNLLGAEDWGTSANTSPASLENVKAAYQGYMDQAGKRLQPLPFDSQKLASMLQNADPRLMRFLNLLHGK